MTAAADWLQKRQTDPLFDEAGLAQWLAEDPRHAEAWQRAVSMWESVGDYQTSPELLALRTRVLQKAYQRKKDRWGGGLGRRQLIFGGATAAAAAAVGAGVFLYDSDVQSYTTTIGEMRTIILSDKSRITLDAHSRLTVKYSRNLRRLELLQGRAHFDVAHDSSRPFQVIAHNQTVTALGTDFTVELKAKELTVALFSGQVTVAGATGTPHRLSPLQELKLSRDTSQTFDLRTLDAAQDLAWREGRLIFNNERLADAVERMNNYAPTHIQVETDVADLRISGMFMVGQTNAFIDALQAYYPLRADISPNRVIIRSDT
ncbi:MAG: FecR domain-containing protein [Asticcacaulis sp.]